MLRSGADGFPLALRRDARPCFIGRFSVHGAATVAVRLPPLNALRAFEAAARHGSVQKAAQELFVTPAAVSQQVKAVEEHLGVALFHRLPRRIELTEAGSMLLPKLSAAFQQMAEAVAEAEAWKAESRGRVLIAAPPAFGSNWILPRLQRLQEKLPEVELRLAARTTMSDEVLKATEGDQDFLDGNDIAIRFGGGHYPGYHSHKLFSLHSTPLCSPALIDGKHPLREPLDLQNHTLLNVQNDVPAMDAGWPKWSDWLKAANVPKVSMRRGPVFNQIGLAIEAAADGMGIVLAVPLLATSELTKGRLTMPFHLSLTMDSAYYLVTSASAIAKPEVVAVRDWILQEARMETWAKPLGGLQPMRWIP